MNWNKSEFYNFILNNNVIGFFNKPLKLSSGRLSYWYVNWRNVAEDVYLIDCLSDFVIAFINDLGLKPDCFFGVPEGATKLGIITQYKWAKNHNLQKGKFILSMGRGKPKEHGAPKDRYFLGVPKGKIILIEDVTTTGNSLLESIDKIRKINAQIIAAIGLTNRDEIRDDNKSVEQVIKELGIDYYAMSDALELLPLAIEKFQPSEEIIKQIENYFKKYGINQLKLK
ncbi:MAG: orotate phosphoribosyltransferase [Promethearchaeota archaeon]